MQTLGVFSFVCCVFTMYTIYMGWINIVKYEFAICLLTLLVSLVISGVASYTLLGKQRAALARHVDERARRASQKFEELKAKEDVD